MWSMIDALDSLADECNITLRDTQNMIVFKERGGFPGVWGLIDCTHVPITASTADPLLYRKFFNRKRIPTLNVQVVAGPDMRILNMVNRWPGSAHDSRIFRSSNLFRELKEEVNGPGYLLGDAGYAVDAIIMTPFYETALHSAERRKYNKVHAKTRNLIERVFGCLKKK